MSGRSMVKSRGGGRGRTTAAQAIKATRAQMRRVQYASSRSVARRPPTVVSRGGTEIKQVDFELSPAAVPEQGSAGLTFTTGGSINVVNLVKTGSGFYNRVGRKVTLRSLRVKFTLADEMAASSETQAAHLRILVVYDTSPNGVLPLVSDILQDINQDGGTSTSWVSDLNQNNRDRFRILRDMNSERPEVYNDVNNVRTSSGVVDQQFGTEYFDEYIKTVRGWDTCYKSDASPITIADCSSGAVYVVCISDQDLPGVHIRGKVRTTYTDA